MIIKELSCKGKQSYEATVGGVTDINWLIQGYSPGKFPLSEYTVLPFLNLNSGKVDGNIIYGGEINSRLFEELYEMSPEIQKEYADVKVLFVYVGSPYYLFTTRKPVNSLESAKGLKIKAFAGPPTEMWKALGVIPLNIAISEAYEALDKGVIDGIESGWAGVGTQKLYYVCKYRTDVTSSGGCLAMIMNRDKWNSLSSDLQQAIMSVSGVRGAEFAGQRVYSDKERESIVAMAQKDGKTIENVSLAPGEYEKWLEVGAKPVWSNWAAQKDAKGLPGQKVIDAACNLMEKYRVR